MTPTDIEKLADEILLGLRRRPGKLFSLKALANNLRADLGDTVSALTLLRQWGYRLNKSAGKVALRATPDSLTATEISYGLKTRFIGRAIHCYQSVKSTNDIAIALAEKGQKEGTIVTAEEQTRGKGRLGRSWHSPARAGIYISIILRPRFEPELAPGLAIMTSLALADTLNSFCPGSVRIKWPNDIQIGGRKVAGILTELSAEKSGIDYVVIGTGINVNHRPGDFPEDLRAIATSVRAAVRKKVRRIELLQDFLRRFEKEYLRYTKRQLAPSRRRLLAYSSLIGSTVKLSIGRKTVEGLAVDINKAGELVIERDGRRQAVSSGEVTVIKDGAC
ncbi:MAG: biotin--[acetyl-CoA-carboxylase] ligase [Candidatus Zixiibacteriota bacterium]|nr:MAG: biotin--[acetyl-CoA-carboxylase] ligase [candidate division Zixibacteria bacterium]